MKKKVLFIFALLCAVAQGAWADNIDLSTVTEDVEAKNGDLVKFGYDYTANGEIVNTGWK